MHGAGFKGEPVLNFEPPIWSPANYTLTVVSETELKLDLVAGSTWNKLPGALMIKGINVGDGDVSEDCALPEPKCQLFFSRIFYSCLVFSHPNLL